VYVCDEVRQELIDINEGVRFLDTLDVSVVSLRRVVVVVSNAG
jgi:hypothetical protein